LQLAGAFKKFPRNTGFPFSVFYFFGRVGVCDRSKHPIAVSPISAHLRRWIINPHKLSLQSLQAAGASGTNCDLSACYRWRQRMFNSLMLLAAEANAVVALRMMKLMRGGRSARREANLRSAKR
jgi:hypothetical protein